MSHKWSSKLDDFGRSLLRRLGEDPDRLPTHYNPVTRELATNPDFVSEIESMTGFSRIGLSRVATVCQMAIFDREGGPEGDRKGKALRRHWYAWYKTDFAQPFARQIGDVERNASGVLEIDDRAWAGRLSQTYGGFVDNENLTYRELWVDDASRMMERFHNKLFRGLNLLIAVEKDSLFSDFRAAAKALGATTVYSGKGKSSKAAIEKVLREHYDWGTDYCDIDADRPLVILHISDYDYDGESVIGPTFAEQARRYVDGMIYEARVGVQPEHVVNAGHDPADKWYQIKLANSGYRDWANEKALFVRTCEDCGASSVTVGSEEYRCSVCGSGFLTEVNLRHDTAHGYEVEALKTRDYYGLLVDALLSVIPFDYIVERLRDECQASAYDAARRIQARILDANESYQKLLAEFDRLEDIKSEFESLITEQLERVAEPHVNDWRDLEDDPDPADFRTHVERANDWSSPWRPFDADARTRELTQWLEEDQSELIDELVSMKIDW